MAANEWHFTPEMANSFVESFKTMIDEITDIASVSTSELAIEEQHWSGKAKNAYTTKVSELEKELEDIKTMLQNRLETMIAVADTYKATSETAAMIASQMSTYLEEASAEEDVANSQFSV